MGNAILIAVFAIMAILFLAIAGSFDMIGHSY